MTTGLPIVRVPVLSKTIVSSVEIFSRMSPPLISKPFRAPSEVPTWKGHDPCLVADHSSATHFRQEVFLTATDLNACRLVYVHTKAQTTFQHPVRKLKLCSDDRCEEVLDYGQLHMTAKANTIPERQLE